MKNQVSGGNIEPILNALVDRRDSTSSIGSLLKSEKALGKFERYRLILETTAGQLDAAASLLNIEASQLDHQHQSHKNIRKFARIASTLNAAAATSIPT